MRETPLTSWHRQHQAKMMEFGGFLMPVEYDRGILAEHMSVREHLGAFDVSHMGEFEVSGADAARFLDYVVTNQPSALSVGQALYTPMCYENGGTVDDLLVYRLKSDRFMLVVNAGNIEKDWVWINRLADGWSAVTLKDRSEEIGLIALQGPDAESKLRPLTKADLASLPSYHAVPTTVAGLEGLVSRTGYTGEPGFELYVSQRDTVALWEHLLDQGALPVGLGARDTLRLEARLPLYEHELTAEITPLEAGLSPFIKWDKGDFVGKAALARQKANGLKRRSVGLRLEGGIARAGYDVVAERGAKPIGRVTSGTKSPTLGYPIALALIDTAFASVGTSLYVRIRGRDILATVVKTPFYRRSRAAAETS
ncbi:MAG: glycine cleavage system protein T [Sulfobacillus acidophilus]|uniref:Aminomethyltransferase n=1 Tax=Sulfobacillus acidophilus TaxID=53633 RepID=A0A2T2WPH4_9FIRM|nr:MAG: glycine cleavage system protein T [Sulfobacillus acidophilus]